MKYYSFTHQSLNPTFLAKLSHTDIYHSYLHRDMCQSKQPHRSRQSPHEGIRKDSPLIDERQTILTSQNDFCARL